MEDWFGTLLQETKMTKATDNNNKKFRSGTEATKYIIKVDWKFKEQDVLDLL